MKNGCQIMQIIPADGWKARIVDCITVNDSGDIETLKRVQDLVCWALVRDRNGNTGVLGMVTDESGQYIRAADEESSAEYLKAEVKEQDSGTEG